VLAWHTLFRTSETAYDRTYYLNKLIGENLAMTYVTLIPNAPITPHTITALREAVGWERHDEDYPIALRGYWSTISGFDTIGKLVAWCAILSDGVRHAVLIDVIVHPNWQRQGVGQELVAVAVKHIRAHSISIIHVDFEPKYKAFYERCGFRTGLGGIYEG
jgi:GNAT superfamily N-acetyltransferase